MNRNIDQFIQQSNIEWINQYIGYLLSTIKDLAFKYHEEDLDKPAIDFKIKYALFEIEALHRNQTYQKFREMCDSYTLFESVVNIAFTCNLPQRTSNIALNVALEILKNNECKDYSDLLSLKLIADILKSNQIEVIVKDLEILYKIGNSDKIYLLLNIARNRSNFPLIAVIEDFMVINGFDSDRTSYLDFSGLFNSQNDPESEAAAR